MQSIFQTIDPLLIISSIGGLLLFTLIFFTYQYWAENSARKEAKTRLSSKPATSILPLESKSFDATVSKDKKEKKIGKSVAKKANDFYANTDPNSTKKLKTMLIQAGYFDPNAIGYFLAARFAAAILGAGIGLLLIFVAYAEQSLAYKILIITAVAGLGYFIPNFLLSNRAKKMEQANRQGFPDILDLMIVSAEAGLTMEASIERISNEIKTTYPILSTQLNLAALEIRAGRPIDQALHAFGERLRLDEVKSFATMVQQAKELGTSVSDALRVYSEEMRHKRMMKAEEKAYALPAKMSVPVTLFILPTVILIAVIPTIVRFNM